MKSFLLSLATSLVVFFLFFHFGGAPSTVPEKQTETAYARVLRTKTLHCGWFAEPPFTNVDPNTGEKSGIVVDIVNQIASDYDLKVSWETISNFAMMGEDLKQGKYDAICASLISMPRGGLIDSVQPFVYVPAYAYVRSDETRLTALEQLNDSAYRIAGQEGAAVLQVARQKFPNAQFHIIPSAELSEMLTSVVANKADVAFMIPTFFQQFLKNNPGTMKQLDATPLQLFTFAFGVKPEEDGLKSLINNTLERMMASGELADIFKKYDPQGDLIYPVLSVSKK
ncbi:MAG: substrate-binding periplasmic protein [Bdellovibrionales bacterium]